METRLSQIESSTLSAHMHYKPGDKRVDEKRGKKDGQRDKPETDAKQYPFRDSVTTDARAALKRYNDQVDNLIGELTQREQSLQQDLDDRYAAQRDILRTSFQDQTDRIEQTLGPNSTKHSGLRAKNQKSLDRERQLELELQRPLRVHLRYVYALIMAGVAIVELPINRYAFELYFAETPVLSLIIGLGIGVALMLFAHFGGTWLKRSTGAVTANQRALYLSGVAAVVLLVLPTLYLIALLRQHYVQFIENQQITFSEMLRQGDLERFAQDIISTDLGTSGLMLLMINIVVVGIGVIASVVRHDAHPDYERAVRARESTERRLGKVKGKHDRALAKAKSDYDTRMEALDKQQEGIEREMEEVRAKRKQCLDHKSRVLERVALNVKQRLQAYETGNDAARSTKPPSFFWRPDEAAIKQGLEAAFVHDSSSPRDKPADIRAVT